MTDSVQREPTSEDLWAQPPADATAYPGQQLAPMPQAVPTPAPVAAPADLSKPDKTQFVLAIVSLGIGVPLSAIAGGISEFGGLLLAWVGIVLVNLIYAWSRRPR